MAELLDENEKAELSEAEEGGAPVSAEEEPKDPAPEADAPQEGESSEPQAPCESAPGTAEEAETAEAADETEDPDPDGAEDEDEDDGEEPDPDDEPLPKYVLPVFLGVLLLIAALMVVLFAVPGLARSRSDAGSASSFSSAPAESLPESSSSASTTPTDLPTDEVPDFELYGAAPYLMEEGEPYIYMTEDIDDEGTSLVGVITARSFITGEPSKAAQEFAAAQGIDLTGYESRRVTFEISFEDGYPDMGYFCTDYYKAALFEDAFETVGTSADGEYEYYAGAVTVKGAERGVYLLLHFTYDYEESFVAAVEWDVLVPEGYDGICICYYNTMLEQSEDYQNAANALDFFDRDNMFFFRCD